VASCTTLRRVDPVVVGVLNGREAVSLVTGLFAGTSASYLTVWGYWRLGEPPRLTAALRSFLGWR